MANTLTYQEYLNIKDDVVAISTRKIKEYVTFSLLGRKVSKDYIKSLGLLVVLKKAIDSWEQDNWNSINFSNYINSNDIRRMYSKIKEITYVR